jgi:hypothetical protein
MPGVVAAKERTSLAVTVPSLRSTTYRRRKAGLNYRASGIGYIAQVQEDVGTT